MRKKRELLEVGDVIRLEKGHRIYGRIQEQFVYKKTANPTKLCRTDIPIGRFDEYPEGEYLVVKTTYDGGATGLGMNRHDDYPDGHHVFCQKLNSHNQPIGEIVDFYQTGSFTAMIEEISPVRRLVPNTVWKEKR